MNQLSIWIGSLDTSLANFISLMLRHLFKLVSSGSCCCYGFCFRDGLFNHWFGRLRPGFNINIRPFQVMNNFNQKMFCTNPTIS